MTTSTRHRLTTKNRNINGHESMPKDNLLIMVNNNNGDRNSIFKSKKKKPKKVFISQQEIVFLN